MQPRDSGISSLTIDLRNVRWHTTSSVSWKSDHLIDRLFGVLRSVALLTSQVMKPGREQSRPCCRDKQGYYLAVSWLWPLDCHHLPKQCSSAHHPSRLTITASWPGLQQPATEDLPASLSYLRRRGKTSLGSSRSNLSRVLTARIQTDTPAV